MLVLIEKVRQRIQRLMNSIINLMNQSSYQNLMIRKKIKNKIKKKP